jgi:hypothetical protein
MNVEFCNSNAFKVDSPDLKEKVMLECDLLFGTKLKRGHFPGPQPVAIEKKNFEMIGEYMVCEKSDGERAILLLINLNKKPMCFIINRNNDFYFVDLSFKKEVFEGTIMDGELIKTKNGKWNYLIHDCMIYNGVDYTTKNHRLRYAAVIDLIVKRYQNKEKDPINIKTKLFYKVGPGLGETWKHISDTTENKIDGLIFTPIDKPIKFGRDYSLLKWKETHTLDFLVSFKGKKMNLKYVKGDDFHIFKTYSSGNENYKKVAEFVKENKITSDDPIIEFKVISEDSFTPYRFRSDKNMPNGEITIKNTFINIEESITIQDIVDSINAAADPALATSTNCGGTTLAGTTECSGTTLAGTTNCSGTTLPAASTDSCLATRIGTKSGCAAAGLTAATKHICV